MTWRRYLLFFLLVVVVVMAAEAAEGQQQLVHNFYASTCPDVEQIVGQAVVKKLSQTPITVAGTLRLFFHDCAIEGCDASIMIASPDGDAEKDAPDNLSLAGDGFDTVIKAKAAVEAVCPGVVSCADVLAIAARDVVVLAGGPTFNVELGRRDGMVSSASMVAGRLPQASFNLSQLVTMFEAHNLSMLDMIALSGAHTVGFSHCDFFSDRLYNFSSSGAADPSLDPKYASKLMVTCPPPAENPNPNIVVPMDPATPTVFDNLYYKELAAGDGLFTSDEVLFAEAASQPTVLRFASDSGAFFRAFATAMVKLGRSGVKTGTQGEIRSDCTKFNS